MQCLPLWENLFLTSSSRFMERVHLLKASKPFFSIKITVTISWNKTYLQPILLAIGTGTYNPAKFFVPIHKEFTINEYTVSDSFSFCKEIKDLDFSLFMALFDIHWLFTNIPLYETINICVDRVFQNKGKVKGLLKRHFIKLLMLAVKSSCFVFNDIYYKQIDGIAMVSPLGPTFANLILVYYEHKWLDNCPLQFKSKFYCCYVDNIFLMFD